MSTVVASSAAVAIEKQFRSQSSDKCISVAGAPQTGSAIQQQSCLEAHSIWDVQPFRGSEYRIVESASGLCLAANPHSPQLSLQECDDAHPERSWRFNFHRDNFYEIRNSQNYLCLHVEDNSSDDGTALRLENCTRANNQHWLIENGVPDTAETLDYRLLVVLKPVVDVPDIPYRDMTPEVRERVRVWLESRYPELVRKLTNGRLNLQVFFYQSPFPLTFMQFNTFNVPEYLTPGDIREDLHNIARPGWFDGLEIVHNADISTFGHVSLGKLDEEMEIYTSNVRIYDDWDIFHSDDDPSWLGGTMHEWLHQVEAHYYHTLNAPRFTTLHSGDVIGYKADFEGYTEWIAWYRDFLNGMINHGSLGLGDSAWSTGLPPRFHTRSRADGGPFENSRNDTCINTTSPSGRVALDTIGSNHASVVSNGQHSIWTGDSIIFNGTGDFLKLSNLVADSLTLSAWIKSSQVFPTLNQDDTTPQPQQALIYAGSIHNRAGFSLAGVRAPSGNDVLIFNVEGYESVQGLRDITTGEWTHVAVVRDHQSGTSQLYVNGLPDGKGDTGYGHINGNPVIKVATDDLRSRFYAGALADLCVHDSALDETEIASLAETRRAYTSDSTPKAVVYLDEMQWQSVHSDWGITRLNLSIDGNALRIGGRFYSRGIGSHAFSKIVYQLTGPVKRFVAEVGIDDEIPTTDTDASVNFEVIGDGKLLYRSRVLGAADTAEVIDVDIRGVTELTLVATQGDDKSITADHANWANARIVVDETFVAPQPGVPPTASPEALPIADFGLSQSSANSVRFHINSVHTPAVAHYQINAGTQQNVSMKLIDGRHVLDVDRLLPGDQVSYFLTYNLGMGAQDSRWVNYSMTEHPAPAPTPIVTPTPTATPTPTPTATATPIVFPIIIPRQTPLPADFGVMQPSSTTLRFYINSMYTPAVAHYQINGGAQQNVSMTQVGDTHRLDLFNLQAGDQVSYFLTYNLGAGAQDSRWISYTVTDVTPAPAFTPLPPRLPPTVMPSSPDFGIRQSTTHGVQFYINSSHFPAVAHYQINGGGQLNVEMIQRDGAFLLDIDNLTRGDHVRYFLTYNLGEGAGDSAWASYTLVNQ